MEKSVMIDKYARLAIESGINLKEHEGLIISTSIHGLELARAAATRAWSAGAKHVEIMFNDEELTLARYENGKEYVFNEYPKWKVDSLIAMYEDGYHHLFITSANPELLRGIPEQLVALDQKTSSTAAAPALKYRMTGRTKWTILAVPSPAWAAKVFAGIPENEAMDLLWDKIFEATRVTTDDPVKAWRDHDRRLKQYVDFLNRSDFAGFRLKGPGTDLDVGLATSHLWVGGSKKALNGDPFVANIPTEEVFTTPHKLRVNGTLKATKPLSVNGRIVRDFGFTFRDGKVTDLYAGEGIEVLESLITNDEGASYLGEIALVPDSSPISDTGILFNNTLFDENASVHFALGRAYPYAIHEGSDKTTEELVSLGANYSLIHTDFMVGGPELEIAAYSQDGSETTIFRKGNWAI